MKAVEDLLQHLEMRPAELARARSEGRKVIGYIPGGYFPEELALAAGAIPVGLVRGGDYAAVERAGEYICRWIDPFCRSLIGLGVDGGDPWYRQIDLLVVPVTDNHVRAVADVLSYNTDLEIFPFGVPHMKEEAASRYYRHGITRLRKKIEAITETQIIDDKLKGAFLLCNRERELFRRIQTKREAGTPPISSRDFIMLQHGSQVADKNFMVGLLAEVEAGLAAEPVAPPTGARLLLTGSTLAWGDTLVTDLIEKTGAAVVAEVFDEGLRWFDEDVDAAGDLMEALADAYFNRRVCPAWFRPGGERNEYLVDRARRAGADGVVWYHLMFRESHKTESFHFPEILKAQTGLPVMVVESDYEPSEAGNIGVRIETFLQNLKG
jgi:benzoyl-CoA reductase/2-hydroxyglutaryl-CoA dehydratase subunit BcrC/BadD/HgdB